MPRSEAEARLSVEMLMGMADADKDGYATRQELVDMLRRMKDYDGGHMAQEKAKVPRAAAEATYGESHEERVSKKRRKKKPRATKKAPKDEV